MRVESWGNAYSTAKAERAKLDAVLFQWLHVPEELDERRATRHPFERTDRAEDEVAGRRGRQKKDQAERAADTTSQASAIFRVYRIFGNSRNTVICRASLVREQRHEFCLPQHIARHGALKLADRGPDRQCQRCFECKELKRVVVWWAARWWARPLVPNN